MCTVTPPSTPGTSRFLRRMFAKVPRIITSWLPRRAPNELKSSGFTPCSVRYFAAGPCLSMSPAGEVVADGLGVRVPIDVALERVRDHQRRRRQEVVAHERVHAALEVAVARDDRGGRELVLGHRLRDALGQRPRVSDARRAAVP